VSNWPPTPNWLGPAFDSFVQADPELIQAYDWPDYPGDMAGEGNWLDLYIDANGANPVGRLWVNPDKSVVGISFLEGGNLTYYTKACLELREMFHHEVTPLMAFDFIKQQFFAGEQQSGELANAQEGTVVPQ
jgi:hypothetical protein